VPAHAAGMPLRPDGGAVSGVPDGVVLAVVVGAFVVGATLKGVTGLGLPPVVLPVLAPVVGLTDAVALLALPTVVGNGWLVWTNRRAIRGNRHLPPLAVAAAAGGVLGAVALTGVDERAVAVTLVVLVVGMLAVRLARPHWRLAPQVARRGDAPVGLTSGVLQGATGMAGPLVGTWVNALGLDRDGFVLTTSAVLQIAALTQAVTLTGLGVLGGERLWQALAACAVVLAMLPVGQRLGRRLPQVWFDRLALVILLGSALGLLAEAW